MNERRLPLGVLVIIPIAIGFGVYAFTGQGTVPPAGTPTASGVGDVTGTALAGWTATAVPETGAPMSPPMSPPPADGGDVPAFPPGRPPTEVPYPTPMAVHGAFHVGAWVRVNAGPGECLNARTQPSVSSEYVTVNECVPDGYEGVIAGTAAEAEGRWWWRLAGSGWVAEEFLTYIGQADLTQPVSSRGGSLIGATGQIAFVRDDAIWAMDADGGNQAIVAELPRVHNAVTGDYSYAIHPTDLAWSPDGTMLSYNIARQVDNAAGWPVDLHIVRRDGSEVRLVPGAAGRGWSPDGGRIGIVIGALQQQMGGGWKGVPALLDVTTGDVTRLDADEFYQQDPPAFNYDATLVLLSRGEEETAADGTVRFVQSFVVLDLAGNVVVRITQPENAYYSNPLWSPSSNQIAFYESQWDGTGYSVDGYAVYDLAPRAIVGRSASPDRDPNAGGKCGGGDMFRTSWSADGRMLYYAAMDRVSGMNGVWAWDVATGDKRRVPASYVIAPSAGPGSLVAFGSDGYIFIGDAATGRRMLVTDGVMPVWGR